MLVHICCSVDSHYFLKKLKEKFPNEHITGFFYNPNIHPKSEFELRYEDVKRSCEQLGIELVKGDYEDEAWLFGSRGLENEPERGERCAFCFDFRMAHSARLAHEMGCRKLTTTLLMSPKKSLSQLGNALAVAAGKFGLEAVVEDFRKNGGTNEQFTLAKEAQLYHQNYCGCVHALVKQHGEFCTELFEPLGRQAQTGSVEARRQVFSEVAFLQKQNISFELVREKVLNYRLLRGGVSFDGRVVESYFLFYSFLNKHVKFAVNGDCGGAGGGGFAEIQKECVKLMSLESFNKLGGFGYKSVGELCKNPPNLKDELFVRSQICPPFSLSPVVVVGEILAGSYEVWAESKTFDDTVVKIRKNEK